MTIFFCTHSYFNCSTKRWFKKILPQKIKPLLTHKMIKRNRVVGSFSQCLHTSSHYPCYLFITSPIQHSSVWDTPEEKCPVLTTKWSRCSSSCGMGVSSRISNKNTQCKLKKETRICTVRPCHSLTAPAKVRWTELGINSGRRRMQVQHPHHFQDNLSLSLTLYNTYHSGYTTLLSV